MKDKKNVFILVLFVIIFITILFMPNLYKYFQNKNVPSVYKIDDETTENKIEKITINSEIVKNLKYPIMRYNLYDKKSYYEQETFKIQNLTNEQILTNAFVDIYEGNIQNYNKYTSACVKQSKQFKASYINSRIKNILSNSLKYNNADFNVYELDNYSNYLGAWKYDSGTDSYIYYGICNKQNGTKYYDLKAITDVKAENKNKTIIVYAYIGFASVNNNNYIMYSDTNMTNKIGEGSFISLQELNKTFNNSLRSNKFKKYKFVFEKGLCTYGDYCLSESGWVNE